MTYNDGRNISEIVEYLKENTYITVEDVERILKCGKTQAKKIIRYLKESKIIECLRHYELPFSLKRILNVSYVNSNKYICFLKEEPSIQHKQENDTLEEDLDVIIDTSKIENLILEYIIKTGFLIPNIFAKEVNINYKTIRRNLKKLEKEGLIVCYRYNKLVKNESFKDLEELLKKYVYINRKSVVCFLKSLI